MRTSLRACLGLVGLLASVPAAEARVSLPRPARGFQMRMHKFKIDPGREREVCEFRTTPNRKPMDVQGFRLNMSAGSHHFVLWEYLGTDRNRSDFPTQLVDAPGCVGVGPRGSFAVNANLFGMQTARAHLRFPPGIAVRLEAHAPVFLNAHLRNFSPTKPLTAQVVFNVTPAPKGTVQHHAQALIVGNMRDIYIPPRSSASLTSEWHAPVDLNVVQISTHQHKRGTHTSVHRVDAAGNDMGELFEAETWDHPGERWFNPAFRLQQGEGFRFTCEWQNPDDRLVTFGVTTDDEMCFVTGYFYPDDEAVPVRGRGCLPQGAGLLCFGAKVP